MERQNLMHHSLWATNRRISNPTPTGSAANDAAAGKKHDPLSVLVVDDEPLIRWSLKRGLTRRGHDVIEADSAAGAMEAIGSRPSRFNVVILDFRLPDSNDLSLLARIRQALPSAVVVMMTAFGDSEMRTGAKMLGARAVIDKPFQINDVIDLVEAPTVN
jgi:two-component system NtrC family response regulator